MTDDRQLGPLHQRAQDAQDRCLQLERELDDGRTRIRELEHALELEKSRATAAVSRELRIQTRFLGSIRDAIARLQADIDQKGIRPTGRYWLRPLGIGVMIGYVARSIVAVL